jgi:hypothetical protein
MSNEAKHQSVCVRLLFAALVAVFCGFALWKAASSGAIPFVNCKVARPFPADWKIRRTTPAGATAEMESDWADAIAVAHKLREDVLRQTRGRTDAVAQYEKRHKEWQGEWAAFLGKIKPGDELWFYYSRGIAEGYAIIRGGKAVTYYPTKIF